MLVFPNSTLHFARSQAGGKGYNLYRLSNMGMPVPEWVALSSSAYTDFVKRQGLEESINEILTRFSNDSIESSRASSELTKLFQGLGRDETLWELVRKAFDKTSGDGMISVRSSAADEDGAGHSFAGQLSSFLYVDNQDDAYRYTLECWASGFTERCLSYRKESGLSLEGIKVAVIFQRMIDPDTSGVMFTCDPISGERTQYLLSAVYGVGEGLVSGALDADTFVIDAKDGKIVEKVISDKTTMYSRKNSGECFESAVDPHLQKVETLTQNQLAALFNLGKKIFEHFGDPQDIEWAIAEDKCFILQTRPVTSLKINISGYPNLWDNSNIVESYSGLTSPLSFSFALRNYRNVYIQFCEVLHVPHQVVKEMESYLGNMLGCINGRVFYNLYNWYKLVGVLPGFKQNREFMETMMGVGEKLTDEVKERIRPHPSWDTPLGKFRKFKTGVAFLYYHLNIQKIVDRYLETFRTNYEYYRKIDYTRMSADRIHLYYLEMEQVMLGHWKAPIINDFLCMVHFGLLKKLTNSWLSDLDSNIQNDLLAGDGNYESAEPTKALIEMAGRIARNEKLRDFIESSPSCFLYEMLNQSPYRDLYLEIESYIDRFGFRCMNEMKLEEIDLSRDPSFLFDCLKNYLRSGTTSLDEYEKREKKLRNEAEKAVSNCLGKVQKQIYFWVLHHARKAVRNRENTRFCRTRAYGVARQMLHAMGDKLAAIGIIDDPSDIFYLTIDEVSGIYNGTLSTYNLPRFVSIRKAEYARYEELEPKIRFQTRGPVYWQNDVLDAPESPDVPDGADFDLSGLACCPGVVEAKVKVVHSPKDDLSLNGDILVCKRTDPGWVPLFPSASALLVERGSLLSHSAIVAREMGIPAIVGIKGLLNTLETGMTVRMDGSKGTITIIEPNRE